MPSTVSYTLDNSTKGNNDWEARQDPACWTAFRTGAYVLPQNIGQLDNTYYPVDNLGKDTTYRHAEVVYTLACESFVNDTDIATALAEFKSDDSEIYYTKGNCTNGEDVYCVPSDAQPKQCRTNVRMQAAFILTGCLFIKATYMIVLLARARHQRKSHCLTYGDVIVASVLDPSLKIQNECMLNSGDGWRQKVEHTCHKHCKDPVPSMTGDDIGHCQKCKKFNKSDKAADLPHPSIAIKYKRSLLSNLGSNAITQMIILMFTSIILFALSVTLLVAINADINSYKSACPPRDDATNYGGWDCDVPLSTYLKDRFGTWGGFSSSAMLGRLSADSLQSEFIAFAVSNGPQFLYSLLYLLLIYNLTLISMEHEWGSWEEKRRRPRCTIVKGQQFEQSYFLQLPSKILLPLMVYAALMHWLLGQAISTIETIFTDPAHEVEHSIYFVSSSSYLIPSLALPSYHVFMHNKPSPPSTSEVLTCKQVTYAAYPIFLSTVLMMAMTAVCWWAFTYTREGFIPQMSVFHILSRIYGPASIPPSLTHYVHITLS